MINYGQVKSSKRPTEFEITSNAILIASDIHEYEQDFDGQIIRGYEYNYVAYDKDEYLTLIMQSNNQAINELTDELQAAKILLGVE